ncbi:MAG: DUF697 domain-containing protein [Acidobacteriota bacterium]
MRDYPVPRLVGASYYVVFCDCGRELKRFPDEDSRGQERFEIWRQQSSDSEQWCPQCYRQQAEKARPTIESFTDDLAVAIRGAIGEMDFSQAALWEKREAAKKVSHVAATICAAIALQPIPIADLFLLTPIQILLVQSIGRIYGVPLSTKTALEVATNIGLGVLLRQIFVTIIKIGVPMMGGLLASTYVYATTYYMGRVAQYYFEKGRPLTAEEIAQMQSSRSRAEDRLRELESLKSAALITEEEYQRKRIQILDEI